MSHQISPNTVCLISDFYRKVTERLNLSLPGEYALISFDIDNFSAINTLFGYDIGSSLLERLEITFINGLAQDEYCTRPDGDHCILFIKRNAQTPLKDRSNGIEGLQRCVSGILPNHYSCVFSGGIIEIDDPTENIMSLLDKANFARKRAKLYEDSAFLYYDKGLDKELKWQNIITQSMKLALDRGEFEMYLQPKVLLKTHQVIGAEALVRWNSKTYGLIYPDQFIPVLEKNGFIVHLDFYMLEQACKFIQESIAEGNAPLSISVNFSKAHIAKNDFAEKIYSVVQKNGIPPRFIEIEITESMISNDFASLVKAATQLKAYGFKVSLDDFGSAYSSLNYLKNLPFDIIKIDKEFLNTTSATDKGRIIVAKIVELIKSIRMIPVAEGVETEDQAVFLEKLSCDVGQGYLYSKPIPVHEYKKYLKNHPTLTYAEDMLFSVSSDESTDNSYLYAVPNEFQMDNWELYTLGQNIDMGLMKGYLDGEATVQYVNDIALNYLGYTRLEFREIFHNSITAFTHPDDAHIVQANAQQLIATGQPLKFQTRAIRKDGTVITLQGRSSCVIDNQGRPVGIYAFQDVTDEIKKTETLRHCLEEKIAELNAAVLSQQQDRESLRLSEERCRLIIEQSGDIMYEWDFRTDTIVFSEKYEKLFGLHLSQPNVTTNEIIRQLIYPDDLPIFEDWVKHTFNKPGVHKAEYRVISSNGDYLWMKSCSTAICDLKGNPIKTIGIMSNITQHKTEVNALINKAQLDPLTHLYNKEALQTKIEHILTSNTKEMAALFIVDIDNFKGINDNLGHQFGDMVLQEVATKTKSAFREGDIVGRLGGDELLIFMNLPDNVDIVTVKAKLLNKLLHMTLFGETTQYTISASIGIAFYPTQGNTFHDLYKMADIALYESKRNGKNRYTIYNGNLANTIVENRTPFDASERFLTTYFYGDLPFNIFEMLYETKDMKTTIDMILELLGKKFSVDRVYIFENSLDGLFSNNTYEWCSPDIEPEIDHLQNVPTQMLDLFFQRYNEEGIMYCDDITTLDADVFEILEPQGIKAMLHCAICKDGKMVGYIGFDDCKQKRSWHGDEIAVLAYVSRILSVFMQQNQIMHQLMQSHKTHLEMLENLNGYVYVIDTSNYELLFLNHAIKELDGKLGQKCYEMAFLADAPCANCPVKKLSDETPFATEEIFSTRINGWVCSAASKLKWDGQKNAALICCTDISKYKQ